MMDTLVHDMLPKAKREPDVSFWLPGPPRGKGMPRSRIVTTKDDRQFIGTYTDVQTRNYEAMLRYAGQEAMKRAGISSPLDCALRVRVTAIFPIPPSWPLKRQRDAREGFMRPTTRPDCENIAKGLDGLKAVVWRDDALIVEEMIRKFFGDNPGLNVEVWRWTGTML